MRDTLLKDIPKPKRKKVKGKKTPSVAMEKGSIDLLFLLLVMLLLVIGLVSLFSASHAHAYYYYGNSYNFIFKQVLFAGVGTGVMFCASAIDYRLYRKFAWAIYGIALFLLCIVFFFRKLSGAHRWIIIGSVTVQPSEIAKFAIVVIFATLIEENRKRIDTLRGITPMVLLLGVYAVLIILEPHLSGTFLTVAIGALLLFVAGAKVLHLLMFGILGGTGAYVISKLRKLEYAVNRIAVWKDPWIAARGAGYQNIQSLYAIGSGGLKGVGIGNSSQKYLYLPEPQNDFIFAIVAEEVGFIGTTIIIILFALLVWRGITIAMRCPDRFGSFVALGLSAQVGLQAIMNIMVVTKMVPNTGISLPFFSAGGTSLIMLLAQMGVVLSISRYSSTEPKQEVDD